MYTRVFSSINKRGIFRTLLIASSIIVKKIITNNYLFKRKIDKKLIKLYIFLVERGHGSYIGEDTLGFIYLDPSQVTHYFGREPAMRFRTKPENNKQIPTEIGGVRSGNWDKNNKRFNDTIFYKSFKQHFNNGVCWKNTELYDYLSIDIQNKIYRYDCSSISELDSHFEQVDQLYDLIKKNGYKRQIEILNNSNYWEDNTKNRDVFHPFINEIGVNIGRNGKIGKVSSGDHRLAISKILNLDSIPVLVRVRHEKWQKTRLKAANSKFKDLASDDVWEYRNHPDLISILRN